MADVKKIDIDGVQWNIKDQEARDRISIIENKTVNLPVGVVKYNQKIIPSNWGISGSGMYYFEPKKYSEILPAGTKPISITLGNWVYMNKYLIIPYLGDNCIGFMTNSNEAKVEDMIIYITYIKA